MARSLNSRCNFKQGFFTCYLPANAVQLVVCVETKCGKHTLKEDKEKRTEKYRPWIKQTDNDDSRWVLESLTLSMSSDSGALTTNQNLLMISEIATPAKRTCPIGTCPYACTKHRRGRFS